MVGGALACALAMAWLGPEPAPTGFDPTPRIGEAPEVDPYVEQAPADVEIILSDTSRAYLEARARLVEHPDLAAGALIARLTAVPPPGPAERKRLLDVLAELGRAGDLELFATELERAVGQASSRKQALEAAERWRPLIHQQGARAVPTYVNLVGNRSLPVEVRSLLLADLIEVTPTDQLADNIALVGRGNIELQEALRRGLQQRAKDPQAKAVLLEAIDQGRRAKRAAPTRLAALLTLRARLGADEPAFVDELERLTLDEEQPFAVRVGAVRGLGLLGASRSDPVLARLAKQVLRGDPSMRTQAAEILGWLALESLSAEQAGPVIAQLDLREDPSPRLAELAYRWGTLPTGNDWLSQAQQNPWPSVRQAALRRVETPCGADTIDTLAAIADPREDKGDPEPAVSRSALQALGRCESEDSIAELVRALRTSGRDDLRAEAARQLVRHGGSDGVDEVAKQLEAGGERRFERQLATALGYAEAPTERATAALCQHLGDGNEVATAAADALRALHPGVRTMCE